jgi:hypothetical protein
MFGLGYGKIQSKGYMTGILQDSQVCRISTPWVKKFPTSSQAMLVLLYICTKNIYNKKEPCIII